MMFQDLSSTPQIISTERPGRYVHVGDLIEEIERVAVRAREFATTPSERMVAAGVAAGLETLASMLATAAATAS